MVSLDAAAPSISLSQKYFRYLIWGQEPGSLVHRHYKLLTEKRIFSLKLEQVVTHCNAIAFQLVYSPTISLFIFICQTAIAIINPVESANKASHYQYKLWENHGLTVSLVITDIYLCGQIYASCLSYASNHPPVGQKLNWNVTQALEKPYSIGIIICRQLVLSPLQY
jgi:hypothetical protein